MDLNFRTLYADEIDIRVGRVINTPTFKGVTLLLYKDARCDMNILDETVGCMNWQRSHLLDNQNCRVGIYDFDKEEWVWKEDTGTESNTEKEKGLASDSFKRACVNWGIGRELYTAKNILVPCELDSEGKKPKNGISWYVKEIEYDKRVISKLVIVQVYKNEETVVYHKGDKVKYEKSATKEQVARMLELGVIVENIYKRFNVSDLEELSFAQASEIIAMKEKALNG